MLWAGLDTLAPFVAFGHLVSTHLYIMTAPFHTRLLVLFPRSCFLLIRIDQQATKELPVCPNPHPLINHLSRSARHEGRQVSSDPVLIGNDEIGSCRSEPKFSLCVQFTHSSQDQIAIIGHVKSSLWQWSLFDGALSAIFAGTSILQ